MLVAYDKCTCCVWSQLWILFNWASVERRMHFQSVNGRKPSKTTKDILRKCWSTEQQWTSFFPFILDWKFISIKWGYVSPNKVCSQIIYLLSSLNLSNAWWYSVNHNFEQLRLNVWTIHWHNITIFTDIKTLILKINNPNNN